MCIQQPNTLTCTQQGHTFAKHTYFCVFSSRLHSHARSKVTPLQSTHISVCSAADYTRMHAARSHLCRAHIFLCVQQQITHACMQQGHTFAKHTYFCVFSSRLHTHACVQHACVQQQITHACIILCIQQPNTHACMQQGHTFARKLAQPCHALLCVLSAADPMTVPH
jgi:hypothetical protein